MKNALTVILLVALAGCGSDDKKEHTELTDYKNKHLDKAKAVENTMNKRVDNINQQLEEQSKKEDDQQ